MSFSWVNVEPQPSEHFKHSIWLDNASNSIVFICEVLSLCCLNASWCWMFLLGSFFGCPSLRHLIIFLIYVLTLAVSISRLSPLIDRPIIFLLCHFFFSSFDCIKGTSCVFSFCSLIFVQFICWIFLYRYLLTFTHFNEWTNFYQSQPNKSMISILIFPWIANIFSRFYQFFHRFQRKLW